AFLQSLLDLLNESREADIAMTLPSDIQSQSSLTFENVTFSYRGERTVFRDVSFDVAPGTTVALVGTRGSGKTSIIRLLFRLYEPNVGRILLDNVPTSNLSLS